MNKLKKLIALGTTVSMLLSLVAVLPVSAATIADGDLVKAADSSAVYYIQGANKRVFPHYNVYLSWGYPADFSTVKSVTSSELAAYTDANAMPFRDGALFRGTAASLGDKDATAVFYVEDSVLRPVLSEQVYQGLFNDASWSKVTWVPDDLLTKFNYDMGENLSSSATHPNGVIFKYSGSDQKYVIEGGQKRAISDAAFAANRYREADLLTLDASETYADGSAVTGVESGLLTPGWLGTTVSSALTASLVATGTGSTIPGGASNVALFSVRLSAGSSAATITGMTFKRLGIGAYDDWDGLYLYDGDTRITASFRTINSDSHEVEFPVLSISIAANSSKVITLRGDLEDIANDEVAAGGVHQFQLKAVETSATVSGIPLSGASYTVGSQDVSSVTVAAGAAPSNPSVGAQAVDIATMRLTAGSNDIEFNQVVLTFSGSLSRSDVSNIKLYQESTLLASAASVSSDDTVTLTLSSPYSIDNGQNKTFSVKADLGGRVNETLTTQVEEEGHLYATDKQYNFGATVSDGAGDYGPVSIGDALTLQGSTVTLTDNGPSAGTIGKSLGDVVLTTFAITADRAVEVRRLQVNVCVSAGADITPGSTTFSDLRIKDADTGATVMSTSLGSAALSEDCGAPTEFNMTDMFNLSANVTRNFNITVDTGSGSAINGRWIRASVTQEAYDADQSYIRELETGDYVYTADIVPNTITGDNQTVQAADLASAVASTPVTALTAIIGASDVDGVGVVLTSGEASATTLTQLAVRVYVNDTGITFLAANEDTTPKGEITKVSLWEDATMLSEKTLTNTTAAHDYGAATFDNLSVSIGAGATKKLVVKFDVDSSSSARWVAIGVPGAGISAYDADGNALTVDEDVNLVTAGTEPDRYIIISTAGALVMAQAAATPDSDIVIAGTSDVETSKIKFTATNEEWTVEKLTVKLNTSANEGSIDEVKISYTSGDTAYTKTGQLTSGTAIFRDMGWVIPKDTERILTISADLGLIDPNVATTGREIQLGIDWNSDFEANGGSQTQKTDIGSADVFGNAMYLRKTRPTVAIAALPSTILNTGTMVINKFSITAGSGGALTVKKFSWDINTNDVDAGGELTTSTWRIYETGTSSALTAEFSDGTTTSATGAVPLTSGASVLTVELGSEIEIAAGATKTFELKGTISGVEQYDAITSSLLNDDNDTSVLTGGMANHDTQGVQLDDGTTQSAVDFLWSDKARGVNHADSYQSTYLDWTNGYLIEVLPSDTQSIVFPS